MYYNLSNMPEREVKQIPNWAAQERASDLEWIGENLHLFWPAAEQGFKELGRGAILTDTTTLVLHESGQSHPFFYVSQQQIEEASHGKPGQRENVGVFEDTLRMVRRYDPTWELVAVLLKGGRESAYRIGVPAARNQK
jgi:hypothetical protein